MSLPTLYEYYTTGGITEGLSANQPYFTLNTRNISIYSGSMHYFRVPKEHWRDRLRKIRAAGLNTVETYVPWNLHEPASGHYDFGHGGSDFENMLDIELFLKTAKEEDLFAIVRPGPYICAEWEFGGFPSWLLRKKKDIQLRTSNRTFMHYVERYFKMLLAVLTCLQFTKGGPIIALQIENEYGSLRRKDIKYLNRLKRVLRHHGIVELLFTSDGPSSGNFSQMPGTLFTGNFQTEPYAELSILQSYQPGKPLLVMEYWTGWFDHWGSGHSKVRSEDFTYTLGVILRFPASVSLYMFVGGTSFGFMNGANVVGHFLDNRSYQPDTSSYDYDAPLSESGEYTEKYYSAKRLLNRYNKVRTYVPKLPKLLEKKAYRSITVFSQLTLDDLIVQVPYRIYSSQLVPMELLPINNNSGQSYGYIIYRKENIYIPPNSYLKIIGRVCDTVMVLVDGVLKSGILEKLSDLDGFGYWRLQDSVLLIDNEYLNATLDLVVENWGRVNFGTLQQFYQYKGLWQGPVTLNEVPITEWVIIPLEFKRNWTNHLSSWRPVREFIGPALYKAELHICGSPRDTFVDMRDWIKGIVIVNGFVLSRYLKLGPQQASYLPAPFLRTGSNEILIFEHFQNAEVVKFLDKQIFENIEDKQDVYTKTIYVDSYKDY